MMSGKIIVIKCRMFRIIFMIFMRYKYGYQKQCKDWNCFCLYTIKLMNL